MTRVLITSSNSLVDPIVVTDKGGKIILLGGPEGCPTFEKVQDGAVLSRDRLEPVFVKNGSKLEFIDEKNFRGTTYTVEILEGGGKDDLGRHVIDSEEQERLRELSWGVAGPWTER